MDGYFLDTNLLVLLVVGNEDRELIPKHRRLEHYSADDYDILVQLVAGANQLFVTPNTLTETSNLLAQHGEPERSRILNQLRVIIHESQEVVVAGAVASANRQFPRLGLTDAALLEAITPDTPLLTTDFRLYLAALEQQGPDVAVNFSAHRSLR